MRRLALTAALCTVLAGCTADSPSPTAQDSPSTTPPVTTTAPATKPPTTPATSPSPTETPLKTDLPDGRNYAYLKSLDMTKRTVVVDVVQFLTGEAAEKAAQEDGEEAFDYYIRNQNKRLRTLSFTAAVKITVNTLTASETGSSSKDKQITLAKLQSFLTKGQAQQRLFYVTLTGGVITGITEQYLP